jgi:hypothetical protein
MSKFKMYNINKYHEEVENKDGNLIFINKNIKKINNLNKVLILEIKHNNRI